MNYLKTFIYRKIYVKKPRLLSSTLCFKVQKCCATKKLFNLTLSKKLFKINGHLSIDSWLELSSHYFSGDPLVHEYFEGQLPEQIQKIVKVFLKTPKPDGI